MSEEYKMQRIKEYLIFHIKDSKEQRELLDYLDQLQQKENIIKEVSEKLNTQLAFTSSYQLNYQSAMRLIEEAKSILDKENK